MVLGDDNMKGDKNNPASFLRAGAKQEKKRQPAPLRSSVQMLPRSGSVPTVLRAAKPTGLVHQANTSRMNTPHTPHPTTQPRQLRETHISQQHAEGSKSLSCFNAGSKRTTGPHTSHNPTQPNPPTVGALRRQLHSQTTKDQLLICKGAL